MTKEAAKSQTGLRLVSDGGGPADYSSALPQMSTPEFSASEMAAEVAELFAMGLLRHVPMAELTNPHAEVSIDARTTFSLHEMLCELRSLSWNENSLSILSIPRVADHSPASACDPAHRRSIRWNSDGQLTLRTLFRGGIVQNGEAPTQVWEHRTPDQDVRGPLVPLTADAPMSDWVHWCAEHNGAGLRHPGDSGEATAVTLSSNAETVTKTPVTRPFFNMVFDALTRGTPVDPGLRDQDSRLSAWTGTRLFSLLAQAEVQGNALGRQRLLQADRLSRPAVMAARLSVQLSREEARRDNDPETLRLAAAELARCAPNLCHWASQANQVQRGPQRFETNLFLPLQDAEAMPPHPADLASSVVVAGAAATLLKAIFDTDARPQLQRPGLVSGDPALGRSCDAVAAQVALARTTLGTHFPAENHADLRYGEAIALNLLRDVLERDNTSASVTLRNFDGAQLRLDANPRGFGQGHCLLSIDGEAAPWPRDGRKRTANLTAVV
ncbi:hypothetical protein [Thalassococcus lentus]|uniref:Bromoperoxidase n=1 Tax=Thalassococcus lentus TaxID=1210524 RepID=A0ABT4XWL5_9RHOB|nr:hypothetical protein [Thalassococcus lentus]MDA7426341.1 hypothetical protein [Thalassococcus lentus]